MALAQWRVAENRSYCPPAAFLDDGGMGGRPGQRYYGGGWGVGFSIEGRANAYGIAGAGGRLSAGPAFAGWPYHRTYPRGVADYGISGGGSYPADNPDGQGEQSLAYVRIDGQDCLYNVWSHLGRRHLEHLLDRIRIVQTGS